MRFPGKNSPAILTVSEVSRYLRIHRTTLYRLLRKHQVAAFKIGNDWRITSEAMDRWLKELEDRSADAVTDGKQSDGSSPAHNNGPKPHGPKSRE
jgi:excisionase family DNA binding protein